MTEKRDNPEAFPVSSIDGFTQHGMTLRDWFAGQALASIPNRSWDHIGDGEAVIKAWASCAYEVADAMLAERAKSEPAP